jgi:hypothetical protein
MRQSCAKDRPPGLRISENETRPRARRHPLATKIPNRSVRVVPRPLSRRLTLRLRPFRAIFEPRELLQESQRHIPDRAVTLLRNDQR